MKKSFKKVFLIFYEMLKINWVDTIYLFFKLSLISLKSKFLNLRPIKC